MNRLTLQQGELLHDKYLFGRYISLLVTYRGIKKVKKGVTWQRKRKTY